MEMAQAARASAWDETLPSWVGCEDPWEVWGVGRAEVDVPKARWEVRQVCFLSVCVWREGEWRN